MNPFLILLNTSGVRSFKINPKARSEINTGFGVNSLDYGGRFVNKSGQPNVEKRGVGYFERISWYHVLLDMPQWAFLLTIILFYLVVNLLFAIFYFYVHDL